jgi:hypothetical protein
LPTFDLSEQVGINRSESLRPFPAWIAAAHIDGVMGEKQIPWGPSIQKDF